MKKLDFSCTSSVSAGKIECSEDIGIRHEYKISLYPDGTYEYQIDGIKQDIKKPFIFNLS